MEKFSLAAAIRMLDSDSLDPETFECDNLFDTNVNTDYLDDSSYAIRENHLSVETNDSEIGQLPLLDPINEDILNTSIESEELESETLSKDSADEHNESEQSTLNDLVDENNNIPLSAKATRSRKRKKNEAEWKQNVRKRRRQSGMEYISSRGQSRRARELKTTKDCRGNCRFKCSQHFTQDRREEIFREFWSLTDDEKNVFYGNTVDRSVKEKTLKEKSRRNFSYKYHFRQGLDRVRVCKEFYLTTLDISQRRVQYFYDKLANAQQGINDNRGRHPKRRTSDESREYIRQHIQSFNRIPSHYCRQSSEKEYLEHGLSVAKMYDMYCDKCKADNVKSEAIHTYRKIFMTEFNISFFKPKKDLCDLCEEHEIAKTIAGEVPPILTTKYDGHIKDKVSTKSERDNDRKSKQVVICFDLENVIACPRSNVSSFFYKRKLNVYNMTGHCSKDSTVYSVVWSEATAGRGSNEMATAVMMIVKRVSEQYPDIEEIVLWSDSCVPQNKNSIMCTAIKSFLSGNSNVRSIIQKFGTPGHSAVQEIDNAHSHIEKRLKVAAVYSPLSLMRILKTVRMKMEIMQLVHVSDYQKASKSLNFKDIPFSKIKSLKCEKECPLLAKFKLSFESEEYIEVSLSSKSTRSKQETRFPTIRQVTKVPELSVDKLNDIESMLKFMPSDDVMYLENLCKIGRCRVDIRRNCVEKN